MEKMINVLIGERSPKIGIEWASMLKKAGFCAFSRQDAKSVYDFAVEKRPEMILLSDGSREPKLIRTLRGIPDYFPYIAVTVNSNDTLTQNKFRSAGADRCISCPPDGSGLALELMSMMSPDHPCPSGNKIMGLERTVTDIIRRVGIPAHIKGYNYIRTAIIMTVENPEVLNKVTKELYPVIAQKFHTTSSCVERAMRHAIEISWDRCDKDDFCSQFGYFDLSGKPTNSEFIAAIADSLIVDQTEGKISVLM